MARVNVPHPEKVRVLLTDPKVTPAELDKTGDLFLEAGLPSTAVMFYDRTKTPDRAHLVLTAALRDGDAFLMDWVSRAAPALATPDAWSRCADEAAKRGKNAFARAAYVKAGQPEKALQIKD